MIARFDGVVTARNVDVGDLISGSAAGGASLFTLQRDDILRVHIDAPQSATVGLRGGLDGDERVIVSPPANLEDGNPVRVAGDPAR